jgi:hypothetical protein
MAPEALPHPGRVPKQRLMSPEIRRRQRQSCGTVLGKMPILLGFSRRGDFIDKRASSEVGPAGLTMGQRGQGLGCAPLW